MPDIIIKQWDETTFLNAREQWNELLDRSTVDALFLSWEWQASWWQAFPNDSMQLKVYAASDVSGKLLAIAPLYLSSIRIRGIGSRRLQFIGNCWRQRDTMPTELLDFIIDAGSNDVLAALLQYLDELPDWDELVIPYFSKQSQSYELIKSKTFFKQCFIRDAENRPSFYLRLDSTFDDYLQSRSKSIRLKLYNRRNRLAQSGNISFNGHINSDIDKNFSLLNQLHEKRWGQYAFTGKRLAFNKSLARLMADKNALSFSTLNLNNRPVSIQYNYMINGHVYNIQSGFDILSDKKATLGYLHFGYEIGLFP